MGTMPLLIQWAFGLTLALFIVVIVIVVAVPRATQRRALRKGKIPEAEVDEVQQCLLEAVQDASTEQGTHVLLSRFWKGFDYNNAQRLYILQPLLKKGILTPAHSSDSVINFWRAIRGILALPPKTVILNQRDWTRMATGASPSVVIKGGYVGAAVVGDMNKVTVTQTYAPHSPASQVGNIEWLVSELRANQISEQDIDDLKATLEMIRSDDQKEALETWQKKLVHRVANVAGQGVAGILANILTPIIMRFLGLS